MANLSCTEATGKKHPAKPKKPHPDYPLFAHATWRWAKTVRQQLQCLGSWSDPDGALQRWLDIKNDLLAGRRKYKGA
jgi:hypothetical protein